MLPSFLPYFPHFLHGRYVSFPASMNGIPFACRRATPQVSSLTQVTSFRRPCSFASHVLSQVSSLTSQTTSFPNPGHSHRPLRLLRRPRPSAGEPRVLLESVDILRVSENGPVHLRSGIVQVLRFCHVFHINLRILQRKLIAEGYEGTVVSSLFYLASGGPL